MYIGPQQVQAWQILDKHKTLNPVWPKPDSAFYPRLWPSQQINQGVNCNLFRFSMQQRKFKGISSTRKKG